VRKGHFLTERTVVHAFPGATALTVLDVYDWITPDGLRGGSAHVHLASAEGYLVLAGAGRLQTLGAAGYAESELRPGDCLWFTPGIIHRLVNEGGLRLLVVMQNAGLPEAGDAVLTFPPEILADPVAYARAAALPASDSADVADAARRRRDLALEGYLTLRDGGPAAVQAFHAAAAALVAGRVPQWRERWRAGPLAVVEATGRQFDRLALGDAGGLAEGVTRRIVRQKKDTRRYGMCGLLTGYDPASAVSP
jgi:mannose-6-phosphate isomerase-like protein (cupin superfamily)